MAQPMTIYCNNKSCMFNSELECTCHTVYYIERLCMTFRNKRHGKEIKGMMEGEHRARCHRENGKYKSNSVHVIK